MDRFDDLFWTVSRYFPEYWAGTIASAAFGVFAGAWINSRIQKRKAVVEELNAIRAALALCFYIMNRFISLKMQHVRSMRDRFVQARQEYEEVKKRARSNLAVFVFHVDLQTLTPLALPVQNLERYVYEKIALGGRALAASADLAGSIDALEESIQMRNTVIVEIHKERNTIPDELLAERYFGLRSAHGLTDERFKASIETIYRQTDDCIFFSRILAEDLATRGDRLRRKNAWRYWFGLPKVMKSDWSKVEQMFPADKEYALWLAGFKTQPTIWQRIRARIFVSSGI